MLEGFSFLSFYIYGSRLIKGDINNLKNALEVYLNRYYLNSSVEVSYKADAKDESNITITIYCIVTEQDNTQYSLGRLLEVADSKITKIMRINNG